MVTVHYNNLQINFILCHNSPMNTTAKDIQDFALAQLDAICNFPDRSASSVYQEVADLSGLSKSLIQQFHCGRRPNLTTDSLDRLMDGVKHALRKAAA